MKQYGKYVSTVIVEIEHDDTKDMVPSRGMMLTKLRAMLDGQGWLNGVGSRAIKRDEDGNIIYDADGNIVYREDSTHAVTRVKVVEHPMLKQLDKRAVEVSKNIRLHKYDIDLVEQLGYALPWDWHASEDEPRNRKLVVDMEEIRLSIDDAIMILGQRSRQLSDKLYESIRTVLIDELRSFISAEKEDIEFVAGEPFVHPALATEQE